MTCPWDKHIFNTKKNTGTVENRLQITVELKSILLIIKANLMLDEIRLKKFPLTSRFCDHFTCFYVLRLAQEPSLSNQAC